MAEEKFKYVKSFMSMVDAIIVVAVLIDSLLHWNNISTNRDNVNFTKLFLMILFLLTFFKVGPELLRFRTNFKKFSSQLESRLRLFHSIRIPQITAREYTFFMQTPLTTCSLAWIPM